MANILLTDEEIIKAINSTKDYERLVSMNPQYAKDNQAIARAQRKKIAEWGKEECPHQHFDAINSGVVIPHQLRKRECPECWRELESIKPTRAPEDLIREQQEAELE